MEAALTLPRAESPSSPRHRVALPLTPTDGLASYDSSLPWRALFPTLLYRIADATMFAVIFPFITDMITSFDAPADKIGLYAGLAEGSLMLVEAVVTPFAAKAADKYGRRPTLILGFLPCAAAAVMVGFSTKVWQVILWRGLMGLNPFPVMGKVLCSEISNPSNRAKVFAIYSPSFATGFIVGVTLGGQLAHAYGRLPWWLGGEMELWRAWPYALPCIMSGLLAIVATIVGIMRLPETRSPTQLVDKFDAEDEDHHRPAPRSLFLDVLRVPDFPVITTIFCLFQFVNFSFDAIFSVYSYTPVPHGGLGLPVDTIGTLMAFTALTYIVATPFAFPYMTKRFGMVRSLYINLIFWPLAGLCLPAAQYFAGSSRTLMWTVVLVQQSSKALGQFSWPLCDTLTMNVLEQYPNLRATGAALSSLSGAGGRAIGPIVAGWLYSTSTQHPAASWRRQVYWLTFLCITLPPLVMARMWWRKDEARKEGYDRIPLSPTSPLYADDEEARRGGIY